MARRLSRGFSRPGKKIDFKQWTSAPGLISSITTIGTILSGSLQFSSPFTILRVRGHVAAFFDSTKQLTDLMILTYGLGIISTDAFTAGTGSVPDPSGEPEYPWLWWNQIRLDGLLANTQSESWGPSSLRLEVDTKAMRKVKPGQTLVMIAQATNVVGAPETLIDIGQMRVLLGS